MILLLIIFVSAKITRDDVLATKIRLRSAEVINKRLIEKGYSSWIEYNHEILDMGGKDHTLKHIYDTVMIADRRHSECVKSGKCEHSQRIEKLSPGARITELLGAIIGRSSKLDKLAKELKSQESEKINN